MDLSIYSFASLGVGFLSAICLKFLGFAFVTLLLCKLMPLPEPSKKSKIVKAL